MNSVSDAIISIRPNFAEAILSGSKTVELRRRIPAISVGTRLWIYATRPVASVVGSAILECIVRGSPDDVWAECGSNAGIERADYDAYFEGTGEALGLKLIQVCRGRPIAIAHLRKMRRGFHPPQVIVKLSNKEATSLYQLTVEN